MHHNEKKQKRSSVIQGFVSLHMLPLTTPVLKKDAVKQLCLSTQTNTFNPCYKN